MLAHAIKWHLKRYILSTIYMSLYVCQELSSKESLTSEENEIHYEIFIVSNSSVLTTPTNTFSLQPIHVYNIHWNLIKWKSSVIFLLAF